MASSLEPPLIIFHCVGCCDGSVRGKASCFVPGGPLWRQRKHLGGGRWVGVTEDDKRWGGHGRWVHSLPSKATLESFQTNNFTRPYHTRRPFLAPSRSPIADHNPGRSREKKKNRGTISNAYPHRRRRQYRRYSLGHLLWNRGEKPGGAFCLFLHSHFCDLV